MTHNIRIPYWVLGLDLHAILFCVLYFGVKISTRVQLTLVLVSASIVTIFMIYVIFKSGSNSSKPFNPSSAGGIDNLFYGVLYAILLFVGFESAANLAEETVEAEAQHPPRHPAVGRRSWPCTSSSRRTRRRSGSAWT